MPRKARPPIPIATQVEVFTRDRWLCRWCRRPTIFHLALKYLDAFVHTKWPAAPLAYWNAQWRRDLAPLLDELAACIDHIVPLSRGGAHDVSNFATACARCNARKSAKDTEQYVTENPPWQVKGKHGEPKNWDGFSSLFVSLVQGRQAELTHTEREWAVELQRRFTLRRPST